MNTTELDKRIDQIREIKRMREELDKELATLEDEIKQAMTEQGVDELRGTNGKATWKAQTRTSVDTKTLKKCQRHFKMSIFGEMECCFLQGGIQVLYSLIHHITCRLEARQALIYQLVLGLTGENGKYNYSKAVHLYPPLFDTFFSAKNYKTAPALTPQSR